MNRVDAAVCIILIFAAALTAGFLWERWREAGRDLEALIDATREPAPFTDADLRAYVQAWEREMNP